MFLWLVLLAHILQTTLAVLLEKGCAEGLARRLVASPELLTQFTPCAHLCSAVVTVNVPMVRLLAGLCSMRGPKRCDCFPNCFVFRNQAKSNRTVLDLATTWAIGSRCSRSAAILMIVLHRANKPFAMQPQIQSMRELCGNMTELDSERRKIARKAIFVLWALRQGCSVDKHVLRMIAKKVFVEQLFELTSAA